MKYLYKYPQSRFPYQELIEENRRRGGRGFEYELMDTGIFDEDRYFDVSVQFAKAGPEDIIIRLEAVNRGPDPAPLHLIPQLVFRNTWSWNEPPYPTPQISAWPSSTNNIRIVADDSGTPPLPNLLFEYRLGRRNLYASPGAAVLFTNNEDNSERLWGIASRTPYVKDAFHRAIVNGEGSAVHPSCGSKAGLSYARTLQPGESWTIQLRLTPDELTAPLAGADTMVDRRKREADEFYQSLYPPQASGDEKMVERQALAGLLWSKQIYLFDVDQWLDGDRGKFPPPASHKAVRNVHWRHLNSMRVLSMPDKWEYPWFAAWDLAFHTLGLALVDPEFAKEQLWLMLFEQFQHPNGQIPAYEWEFSDLNPPVHAWAVWRVYETERLRWNRTDREWLERCFHKLLINFAWWVNKVDSAGNNVFEGGFLGLDNITVIDRSEKLPGGAILEQSDGTGWMGLFCLSLMRIALELAKENRAYEGLATKFFEHYVYIGSAMTHMGPDRHCLWDENDGFFYDVLKMPDGVSHRFQVRSMVGLIPLFAVEQLDLTALRGFDSFYSSVSWFIHHRRELTERCCHQVKGNGAESYALTVTGEPELKRLLERVFDPAEFLSDFGVRSLSRYHQDHPFVFEGAEVRYEPAESTNKIKGGNSNWRGPVWFPTAFLTVEALRKLGTAYGDQFVVQAPGGRAVEPCEMAHEIANRMIRIFTRDENGRRPLYGGTRKFQDDANWRDLIEFHEYFHGDNGAGLGASHQTGWTSLVACLIDEWRR